MEQNLLPLQVTVLATFLFMFMVIKMFTRRKTNGVGPNLPPGPWRLPLIGNVHNLVGCHLHHGLANMAKKHGPLMYLKLGEVATFIISSAEVAEEVMKTHDIIFAQRPMTFSARTTTYNYTDIAFAPYGEYWRQLRKICTLELLSAKRVLSFKSIRAEEVTNLVNNVASNAGSPINISELIFAFTYNVISRSTFGKVWTGKEAFIHAVRKITEAAGGFNIADLYPSFKFLHWIGGVRPGIESQFRVIDKMLEDIIGEHKHRRSMDKDASSSTEEDDLLDVLLNLQENGGLQVPLTTNNIKAVIMDLYIAGSDTVSTTVEWGFAEVLKHPEILRKAQAELRHVFGNKEGINEESFLELKYLKSIIKETLRIHPPVPLLLPRESRQDCKIKGFDIPVKSRILVNAYAVGRDPKYWNEPEKFIPERFDDISVDYKGTDFKYIPFGAGRRMCPGVLYAMANIELLLAHLLCHFDWKLPGGMNLEDLDMTEDTGIVIHKKFDLQLLPSPYII